jgi:hypothetical protein
MSPPPTEHQRCSPLPTVGSRTPRAFRAFWAFYAGFPVTTKIDAAAAAARAHEPRGSNRHIGAVALGLPGDLGLDLVVAILAPHDERDVGSGGSVGGAIAAAAVEASRSLS